ncbi:MAG: hypothetical protein ACXVB0_17620 [Mucilaginibacter sp.]
MDAFFHRLGLGSNAVRSAFGLASATSCPGIYVPAHESWTKAFLPFNYRLQYTTKNIFVKYLLPRYGKFIAAADAYLIHFFSAFRLWSASSL